MRGRIKLCCRIAQNILNENNNQLHLNFIFISINFVKCVLFSLNHIVGPYLVFIQIKIIKLSKVTLQQAGIYYFFQFTLNKTKLLIICIYVFKIKCIYIYIFLTASNYSKKKNKYNNICLFCYNFIFDN